MSFGDTQSVVKLCKKYIITIKLDHAYVYGLPLINPFNGNNKGRVNITRDNAGDKPLLGLKTINHNGINKSNEK